MHIEKVNIYNFRRLHEVSIELEQKQTIFVGANNSGKTSAIDAISKFLGKRKFEANDFMLSYKETLDNLGQKWLENNVNFEDEINSICPTMDFWISVNEGEYHYVSDIIPSLNWTQGVLGIRMIYQVNSLEKLLGDFNEVFNGAREIEEMAKEEGKSLSLYPESFSDYIYKNFASTFSLKSYILDPSNSDTYQVTNFELECGKSNPLSDLIELNIVGAQRGLSDQSEDKLFSSNKLSYQLTDYYKTHLDPLNSPSISDYEILGLLEGSKGNLDKILSKKLMPTINELETLGYPGFSDPKITLTADFEVLDALKHESSIKYSIDSDGRLLLPERYNGLGYQNLMSIIFSLITFRDNWINCPDRGNSNAKMIKPIHLVMIEEPEAHLHAQVQQVFVKKAYEVIVNNKLINDYGFSTQMILSTHSSYIIKESVFSNLRYFKRHLADQSVKIPFSSVVNLSDVFGISNATSRFVTRYMQTTHCDLFFADAAIFVEGVSELMLLPYFIKNNFRYLDSSYLSILNINGRHFERLKPLIEKLGIPSLVITDVDPVDLHTRKKIEPKLNNGVITSNPTITKMFKLDSTIDELFLVENEKIQTLGKGKNSFDIRVAYQLPINVNISENEPNFEFLPSTFEDSLIYTNFILFANLHKESDKLSGYFKKVNDILNDASQSEKIQENIYSSIIGNIKAGFALDLIYEIEPSKLIVPEYINDGLRWLEDELISNIKLIEIEVTNE